MATPPEFYENLDQICALLTRQIKLYGDLRKAMRISDLLGVPPKEMTCKVTMAVNSRGATMSKQRWNTEELVIQRDGEGVFRAKLIDVHEDLWPDDVRTAYARHQKRNNQGELQ